MAENQGVDGDRWNAQAARFFKCVGWSKVGDSNIDIPGIDGLKHGIDMLHTYEDGFSPNLPQGVFIEAKQYATTSFNPKKISDWVSKLDKKIRELKSSETLYTTYPALSTTNNRNGVLMTWFHDLDNWPAFREKFQKSLLAAQPASAGGPAVPINRLFVLGNDHILALCSLVQKIRALEQKLRSEADPGTEIKLQYFYPSSAGKGFSNIESPALNLEYMFSKFVLAKGHCVIDSKPITKDFVFYFGKLDIHSFLLLRNALSTFNAISGSNPLRIFRYLAEDSEFRTIEPDVNALFRESGITDFEISRLSPFADLPDFVTGE